jgi:hypothetical protein
MCGISSTISDSSQELAIDKTTAVVIIMKAVVFTSLFDIGLEGRMESQKNIEHGLAGSF